ncbi:MAG TPA: pirin family protein [Thermoanaerobaculia bacterium]|nr:pirin family protein [Thermoanaerobaculia bacterium]
MPSVAARECSSIGRGPVFEAFRSRETALGALPILRALPVRGRRTIGPWCFLDRYGPLSFSSGKPMDVAPHPHIGLQTVSWLLEGEVVHRDSLGAEAVARPGGVNIMTAGRGIAHSEETPRSNSGRLNGVQLWIALPDAHRAVAPAFHPVAEVPRVALRGAIVRVVAGEFEGEAHPAPAYSDLVGIDVAVHRGERVSIPLRPEREHGVMLLGGDASFDRHPLEAGMLHDLGCGRSEADFHSREGARLLLIGGVPFGERLLMWWNFVARTAEEIAAAREEWERGSGFGEVHGYDGPRSAAPPLAKFSPPGPAS